MQPNVVVIVPASRPEMRDNVLGNFARQSYPNKRLVVAENGRAVGAYVASDSVSVVQCQPGASVARNAALDWANANVPGAFIVTMDDDDYYGPGYIGEHLEHASPYRVTGKKWGWVQFDTGLVYFGNGWSPGPARGMLLGGTLGFFERPDLRFDERIECGEDSHFCRLANGLGLVTELITARHYCLSREGGAEYHTHKAKDLKIWIYAGLCGIRVDGDRTLCSGLPPHGPVK